MTIIAAFLLIYLGNCDFAPSHTIPVSSMTMCERMRIALVNDPIVAKEAGQVICMDMEAGTQYPVRIYDVCCQEHCYP